MGKNKAKPAAAAAQTKETQTKMDKQQHQKKKKTKHNNNKRDSKDEQSNEAVTQGTAPLPGEKSVDLKLDDYQPGQLTGMINIAGTKAPPPTVAAKTDASGGKSDAAENNLEPDSDEVVEEKEEEDSEDSGVREMLQNKYMRRTYLEGGSSDEDEDDDDDEEDVSADEGEQQGTDMAATNGEPEEEEQEEDGAVYAPGMIGGADFDDFYGQEEEESEDDREEEPKRKDDKEKESSSSSDSESGDDVDVKDEEQENENILEAFERGEKAQDGLSSEVLVADTSMQPVNNTPGQLASQTPHKHDEHLELDDSTKLEAGKNERLRRALATQEQTKRTVFIGNVDISVQIKELAHWIKNGIHDVLKSDGVVDVESFKFQSLEERKNASKYSISSSENNEELKKLRGGGGFIESIRFRSVPLKAVPVETGSSFRTMRKAAFIRGNFDASKGDVTKDQPNENGVTKYSESMNAFVVLTSQHFVEPVLRLNGKMLKEKHLRVDRAAMPASIRRNDKVSGGAKPEEGKHRRSVFLGNLSFDATDEELWQLFSQKIAGGDNAIEQVRVVRDSKTNLGKGIGYVVFKDRSYVSEALGLEGVALRGREIRVRRCADTNKGKVESLTTAPQPAAGGKRGRNSKDNNSVRNTPETMDKKVKKPRHNKTRPGRNGPVSKSKEVPSWMGATPGRENAGTDTASKKKPKNINLKHKQEQKHRKNRKAERQAKRKASSTKKNTKLKTTSS